MVTKLSSFILTLLITNELAATDISIADYVKYEKNARVTYADGLELTKNNKNTLLVWVNFTPEETISQYQGIKDPVIHVFVPNFVGVEKNERVLVVGQWKNNEIIRVKDIKSNYINELNEILHPKPIIVAKSIDSAHKSVKEFGDHAHRCEKCGTIWYHDDSFQNNEAAHRCPNCKTGPFYNRFVQQTIPSFNFNYCPPGRA